MKRNHCLDLFKGISCIAVVLFHVPFPGGFGTVVASALRFAVPFFFMVSGYYSYTASGYDGARDRRHIRHMLKLILLVLVLYIPAFFLFRQWGDTVGTQLKDVGGLNLEEILIFLLANQPVFIVGQMWFLFALLYDYILFAVVNKKNAVQKLYPLIPVLLAVYVVLAQGMHLVRGAHIAGLVIPDRVPNYFYRNFLIEGLPFFLLAHYLHSVEERIKVSNALLIFVAAACTVGSIAEPYIFGRTFGMNICTIPQVTAIFLFCICNPSVGASGWFGRMLSALGEKLSLYVYIFHPFFWRLINYLYKIGFYPLGERREYIKPILVLGISIIAAIVAYRVKLLFKNVGAARKEKVQDQK